MAYAWPFGPPTLHRYGIFGPSVPWPKIRLAVGRADRPRSHESNQFRIRSAREAQNAQPSATAAALQLALQEIARCLDAHPDCRVLRRLVPVLDHGAVPSGHDVNSTQRGAS